MRLIDADNFKVDGSKEERKNTWVLFGLIEEQPTVEAIPIKWIVNWLTKQTIPALHTCDEYEAVNIMLDDWEKENERLR